MEAFGFWRTRSIEVVPDGSMDVEGVLIFC